MAQSSVIIEGFVLKCKVCGHDACDKRESNGDPTLWCPQCCNKITGREAHRTVNDLNQYGLTLREQEIYPDQVRARTKSPRPPDPHLKFFIEQI